MNGALYTYKQDNDKTYSIDDGGKIFKITPENWEELNTWLSNYIQ